MKWMFQYNSAFNQDLGWCVDDDVDLTDAFSGTQCESTSCGVTGTCAPTPVPTMSPLIMDDSNIRTAVEAWLSDSAAAEVTYGHISTWETGAVTDMSSLFSKWENSGAASFNEDIGAWDTSGVRSMYYMFRKASAFNLSLIHI